mgnify:CR=1 FL=1
MSDATARFALPFILPGQAQKELFHNEALTRLEALDPRQSQILEQRYFGGLSLEETADALGVSLATVKRELRSARAWLAVELRGEAQVRGHRSMGASCERTGSTIVARRSRSVDHVADPGSHDIVMREVSSRDLTERILENSYHVATLDNDAPVIFEESAEFVRRVTGP